MDGIVRYARRAATRSRLDHAAAASIPVLAQWESGPAPAVQDTCSRCPRWPSTAADAAPDPPRPTTACRWWPGRCARGSLAALERTAAGGHALARPAGKPGWPASSCWATKPGQLDAGRRRGRAGRCTSTAATAGAIAQSSGDLGGRWPGATRQRRLRRRAALRPTAATARRADLRQMAVRLVGHPQWRVDINLTRDIAMNDRLQTVMTRRTPVFAASAARCC